MSQSEQSSIPEFIRYKQGSSAFKGLGNNPFFGLAHERDGMAVAVKFTTALGEQRAIHYHDLVSPMDYDGDTEIQLCTTRIQVTIIGKNLQSLFDNIIHHRVLWIKEPEASFTEVKKGEVEITSIRFETTQ
ncbi:MAG: hypothetical protein AAFY48_14770 [Bacteroidota bacterium]